jgi:hypothetical protein
VSYSVVRTGAIFHTGGRVGLLTLAAAIAFLLAGCAGATDGGVDAEPTTSAPAGTTTTRAPATTGTSTPVVEPARGETVEAFVLEVVIDGERTVGVMVSVDGDWRVDDPEGGSTAFDVVAGTLHIDGSAQEAHVALASSGPDSPHALLDRYLPLVVISGALDRHSEGTAREGSWAGGATIDFTDHFRRPTLSPGAYGDDLTDHVWVSVDETTLLPVSITHVSDQRPVEVTVRRWEVTRADVTEVERSRFTLWGDPQVEAVDHGFASMDLSIAADLLGYTPPVPSWLPDGYVLRAVEVATEPLLWWSYPSLPPSERLAVLTYRRGMLETLTITTRSADTGDWQDPYHRGDMDLTGSPHSTPAGRRFTVVRGPWPFWPVTHAWAVTDGLVVTVGGDIGVTDLLRMLDSLEW